MRGFILLLAVVFGFSQTAFSQVKHANETVSDASKATLVIVYGSDTCHYCMDTKAFLRDKKVPFVYYDVDVNLDKQKEMILKLQNAGIPLDAIVLPIVDLRGTIKVNDVANFEDFLNRLTENKK